MASCQVNVQCSTESTTGSGGLLAVTSKLLPIADLACASGCCIVAVTRLTWLLWLLAVSPLEVLLMIQPPLPLYCASSNG